MDTGVRLSGTEFTELYAYLTSKERLGPGPNMGSVTCDHTLRYTVGWMKEHDIQDISTNIEKIVDLGGHCDCEVSMNVTPDIWERCRGDEIIGPDILGESEWQQFLSDLLYDSGMDVS